VNPWILGVVQEGFRFEFESSPVAWIVPRNAGTREAQLSIGRQEVKDLFQKGAIIKPRRVEFVSPMFISPKATGGFKPIINRKRLNQFLILRHFKMENINSLRHLIVKGPFTLGVFRLVFSRKTKKRAEMRADSSKNFVFPLLFSAPKSLEISKLFGAEIDGKTKVKSRKLNSQSQHSIFDAQIFFYIGATSAMQNLSAVILSIFVIISTCIPRDFWLFVIVFRLVYC
jgi:hypothetical protein